MTKCANAEHIERYADGRCKACTQAYGKKWYANNKERAKEQSKLWRKNNPERAAAHNRKAVRKHRYGAEITDEFVLSMLNEQDNKCAICQRVLGLDYHIDHDHSTGEIRGLLCGNCNWGLGHFRDSPEILARAIDYLER